MALVLFLVMQSCTVVKPVVCTFTWPVVLLSEEGRSEPMFLGGDGPVGTAALLYLGVFLSVGPVGGLVTGVISDVNVLTGDSTPGRPGRNLHHPLLTNARGSGVSLLPH